MENFKHNYKDFEKAITEGLKVTLKIQKINDNEVDCSIRGSVNNKRFITFALILNLARLLEVDTVDLIEILADSIPELREPDYDDEVPIELQDTLDKAGIKVEKVTDNSDDETIDKLAELIAKAIKNEM